MMPPVTSAAPHLGPHLQMCNVAQQDRHAALARFDENALEIGGTAQIARRMHDVLGFRELEHRAARLLIGIAHRIYHLALRDTVGTQPVGIEHDLILLDDAADGRDLGHIGDRLELVFEEPVLQCAQLRQVVPPAAVHQRILIDPTDAGRIRAQRSFRSGRQTCLHLVQIFEHTRACPIRIGAVGKQHIHERITEKGIAAHRLRSRHGQHGRGQRIRDLILDDARRLAGIGGANDHLHVREVRQSIEGGAAQRPHAPRGEQHAREQHQEAIADRPEDELRDHGELSVAMQARAARRTVRPPTSAARWI
jgi:hypothetical protein